MLLTPDMNNNGASTWAEVSESRDELEEIWDLATRQTVG